MDEPDSRDQSLAKLRELIDGIDIAILTTSETDGALRSRPMATAAFDEEGALWFFSAEHTGKAGEIVLNPQVCVAYAAPDKNRFVSISGKCELVRDRARNLALWRPGLATWLPEGPDDPDLALLRVDVLTAEYWEGPRGRLVQLFGRLGGGMAGAQSGTLQLKTRIGPDTAS